MITDCGNTTQDENWAGNANLVFTVSPQPSAGTWSVLAGEQATALRSPDRVPPANLTASTLVTTRTRKVGRREAG